MGAIRLGWVPLVLTAALLACALPGSATSGEPGTPVTQPPATPEPPTPTPRRPQLWTCAGCGGDTVWAFGSGDPRQVTVPSMVQFFGYSPATGTILCALRSPDGGSGTSNISASDLSLIDVASGTTSTLIGSGVVEALYAPNGLDLAYIMATPETYELRWLASDGSDRLLARDVTFSWSIAPSGGAIAFSRESRYGLPIDPGFYVVSVEGGPEVKVSGIDNAGFGSSADAPVWSPDSQELLIAHWAGPDAVRLVLARADGRGEVDLGLDPAYQGEWWATLAIPLILWAPDGVTLVGSPAASGEGFGATPVLRYHLDRATASLRDVSILAEAATPVQWDVPGQSIWLLDTDGRPQSLPLPSP